MPDSNRALRFMTQEESDKKEATKFFSNDFLAIALLSGMGLALALFALLESPCIGIDLNIGCVPIGLTGQTAE